MNPEISDQLTYSNLPDHGGLDTLPRERGSVGEKRIGELVAAKVDHTSPLAFTARLVHLMDDRSPYEAFRRVIRNTGLTQVPEDSSDSRCCARDSAAAEQDDTQSG